MGRERERERERAKVSVVSWPAPFWGSPVPRLSGVKIGRGGGPIEGTPGTTTSSGRVRVYDKLMVFRGSTFFFAGRSHAKIQIVPTVPSNYLWPLPLCEYFGPKPLDRPKNSFPSEPITA